MKMFIVIIMLANVGLILSVLLYALNRRKYYELIELFQKKHMLPAPYLYSSMIGFFGAATMAYFFIRLKRNKSIFSWVKTARHISLLIRMMSN